MEIGEHERQGGHAPLMDINAPWAHQISYLVLPTRSCVRDRSGIRCGSEG